MELNMEEIYNALRESFKTLEEEIKPAPYLFILDQLGNKHLVASMTPKDCVKDGHLIFLVYYKKSDLPIEGRKIFAMALPLLMYAGIEVHAELPKKIGSEYGKVEPRIGF